MRGTVVGGIVVAVSLSPEHGFSKTPREAITLLPGLGVEGDAHCGATAQHLYRMRKDPRAPNLAQVHFLPVELFAEMRALGFTLAPGAMGENVLTEGLDLATLPTGTIFSIGTEVVVEISGIRDPCKQIDALGQGLTKAMFGRDAEGCLTRKAGIMGVVRDGGEVKSGDTIAVTLPAQPHRRLEVV